MRKRIDTVALNKSFALGRGSGLDKGPFEEIKNQRKVLPAYVLERLRGIVEEAKQRFPSIHSLSLIGSYANGGYIDEYSPIDIKEAKEKAGLRAKMSDFDFETVPLLFLKWNSKQGYNIHFCADREGTKVNLDYLLNHDS